MVTLHASCVAVAGRGLLIKGPSGSGKSSLALEMMSRGAHLVADDRVVVTLSCGQPRAEAPPPLRGLIEARGLGLLNAEPVGPVPVCAVLDLATPETDRLPPWRKTHLLGVEVPLLHNSASPYFAASLVQYLRGGRRE